MHTGLFFYRRNRLISTPLLINVKILSEKIRKFSRGSESKIYGQITLNPKFEIYKNSLGFFENTSKIQHPPREINTRKKLA